MKTPSSKDPQAQAETKHTPPKRYWAVAEAIVRRLTENAIKLAIVRHGLEWDKDTDITEDDIIQDVIRVALGEDKGCADPDALDTSNCDLMFVEAELRKAAGVQP